MGIQDLINKYADILTELPKERERIALTIGNDAKALVASRVQNTGIDSTGQKMPLYSKRPLDLRKFNYSNNQGAVAKFKKDVSKGVIVSSYENFRAYHGLPTDKRTTTFTGEMWRDVFVEITEHSIDTTEVTITARSQVNKDKLINNSKYAKANILLLSQEERDMLTKAHAEMVAEFLNKFK